MSSSSSSSPPPPSFDGEWIHVTAGRHDDPFPRFFNAAAAAVGHTLYVNGGTSPDAPDEDSSLAVVGAFDLASRAWRQHGAAAAFGGSVAVRDRQGHCFVASGATLVLFSGELRDPGGRRLLADDLFVCDTSADEPRWEAVPKPSGAQTAAPQQPAVETGGAAGDPSSASKGGKGGKAGKGTKGGKGGGKSGGKGGKAAAAAAVAAASAAAAASVAAGAEGADGGSTGGGVATYWPPARKWAACCDAGDGLVFVHGGRGADGSVLGDAWLFDVAARAWRPAPVNGGVDEVGEGGGGAGALGGDGNTTSLPLAAPLPRRVHHTACFSARSQLVVVFGGADAHGRSTDTVDTYHVPTGEWLPMAQLRGNCPGARVWHGAAVVESPDEPVDKDPFRKARAAAEGSGAPPPPRAPRVQGNPKLVTVGGIGAGGLHSAGASTFTLRLATQEWSELRAAAAGVAVGVGADAGAGARGSAGTGSSADCGAAGQAQAQLPRARHGATLLAVPGTMQLVLLGGFDGREVVSDVDVVDLDVAAIEARRRAAAEAAANANFGRSTYPNGDVYEGFWKGNHRHGTGKCIYASGDVYEGEWADDRRAGQGVCTYANGDRYDGEWRADARHGEGTQSYGAGGPFCRGDVKFTGTWVHDKREGAGGRCSFDDGSAFSGDWRGDRREGQGECAYADGSHYRGAWHADERSGRGVLALTSESAEYTGDFLCDKFHGRGTMVLRDGTTYEGEWRTGKRNGTGKCVYGNRDEYEGKWMADVRSGLGTCRYADGSAYTGLWSGDQRSGRGRVVHADGVSGYEGEWREDVPNGQGVMTGVCPAGHRDRASPLPTGTGGRAGGAGSAGGGELRWQFTGTFKNGLQHTDDGVCTYTLRRFHPLYQKTVEQPHGEYRGAWRKGKRHGRGTMVVTTDDAPDFGTYEGGWEADQRAGQGRHTQACGYSYVGEFAHDLYHGEGSAAWPASGRGGVRQFGGKQRLRTYTGTWAHGQPHGHGAAEFTNGDKFEGPWHDGVRSGDSGVCQYASGDRYDGPWEDDLRHGKGAMTLADGSRMTSTYIHGTVG